jgi:hypothetical protein
MPSPRTKRGTSQMLTAMVVLVVVVDASHNTIVANWTRIMAAVETGSSSGSRRRRRSVGSDVVGSIASRCTCWSFTQGNATS